MTSPVLADHNWPALPETHVWTVWMAFSGPPKPKQYRTCTHPRCAAVQYRDLVGDEPGEPYTERPNR